MLSEKPLIDDRTIVFIFSFSFFSQVKITPVVKHLVFTESIQMILKVVFDSSVFIELEASVCDQATVIEGVNILGRSEVSGRAKIFGVES